MIARLEQSAVFAPHALAHRASGKMATRQIAAIAVKRRQRFQRAAVLQVKLQIPQMLRQQLYRKTVAGVETQYGVHAFLVLLDGKVKL